MAKYALIGDSLKHSQSQHLHSLIGNYEYDLIELATEEEIKKTLMNTDYDGFNVTAPYKDVVIKFLDNISETAKAANAVNVIKRMPNGELHGFNTDIIGFTYMVGNRANGRTCLIMGTGGAARAAAVALDELGAESIILVSRNPEEARKKVNKKYKIISYGEITSYFDVQILVNATPIGMMPNCGVSPMINAMRSIRLFEKLELAVDLIYNPYRTKFLQDARRITGCKTISGLGMLIYQAIEAKKIWMTGEDELSEKVVQGEAIKRDIITNQLNLIAVGMPGSGKTTIFKRYAYEFGMKFIDTDVLTEELMGDSIENVLADENRGEEYFRKMEHEAIKIASQNTGTVIATGGGSILNPVNRDLLRSNGLIIYLRRPIDLICTKNRPLSQSVGVEELFRERDAIYRRMADFTVNNKEMFGGKKAETGTGDSYYYEMKKFVYALNKKIKRYIIEIACNKWT